MSSSIVSGRDVMREKWLGSARGANRTPLCWRPAERNWPLRKRGSAALHKRQKQQFLCHREKQLRIQDGAMVIPTVSRR